MAYFVYSGCEKITLFLKAVPIWPCFYTVWAKSELVIAIAKSVKECALADSYRMLIKEQSLPIERFDLAF